jgi:hypothetical protein
MQKYYRICVSEPKRRTVYELKNTLLIDKDKYGHITCHQAAKSGSLEALKKLWTWPKEAELTRMNCC